MKLPNLDDLEELNKDSLDEEKHKPIRTTEDKVEQKSTPKRQPKKESGLKGKQRIPKTVMNEETGIPQLAIPDLNDIELEAEIEKYLGAGEER